MIQVMRSDPKSGCFGINDYFFLFSSSPGSKRLALDIMSTFVYLSISDYVRLDVSGVLWSYGHNVYFCLYLTI